VSSDPPVDTAVTRTRDTRAYWTRVRDGGFEVPADRPLSDLTVELVDLLGTRDPQVRAGLAGTTLTTWVERGVYDDLLTGLGDGMCEGLTVGRGEDDGDSVLRRAASARVLTAVLQRDNAAWLVHPDTVLRWGDRGLAWLLGERDLRGYDPRLGWLGAAGYGADLLASLAMSRHIDSGALGVLLDALGERLVTPTPYPFVHGEDDRLTYAAMAVLHRNTLAMDVVGPWLERLRQACPPASDGPVAAHAQNTRAFLRALHVALLMGVRGAPGRGDATHFFGDVGVRDELLRALTRILRQGQPFYREHVRRT
jgi:hypothetical protein